MRISKRMKLVKVTLTLLIVGFISSVNATTINFTIDSWNVGYGPYDTVYINIHEVNGHGGHATLYFHRNRLPEILVEYVERYELPKVHYSIEEFDNVYELLKTSKIKSFYFSNDSAGSAAAITVQH